MNRNFCFLWYLGKYEGSWLLDPLELCRKLPHCTPKGLYHVAFAAATRECVPRSSPVSVWWCQCWAVQIGVVLPHCGFNLHFPGDI